MKVELKRSKEFKTMVPFQLGAIKETSQNSELGFESLKSLI